MRKISLFLMVALLILTFGYMPMSVAADLDSIDASDDYTDNVITDVGEDKSEELQVMGNGSNGRLTSVGSGTTDGEPNDSMIQATEILNNTTKNGTIGTPTDEDYYYFTINAPSSLTITMTPPSDKDYDLKLIDSTGRTLVSSCSSRKGAKETITTKAISKGKYYIRVKGSQNAYSSSQYSLSLCYTDSDAASIIDYSISTNGTFLYANNPESINNDIYLADEGLGGHSLMEETVNAGTVQFFAEHGNNLPSKSTFGLSLRVKNISDKPITLSILKSACNAAADDDYGIKTFKAFYRSKIDDEGTIKPGETVDLLEKEKCPYGNLLVAIVRFKVSGTVQVSEYLCQKEIKKDATYIGYVEKILNTDKDQKNYKGVGVTQYGQTAFPIVSNTYSWEIDDCYSGKLPVKLPTRVPL